MNCLQAELSKEVWQWIGNDRGHKTGRSVLGTDSDGRILMKESNCGTLTWVPLGSFTEFVLRPEDRLTKDDLKALQRTESLVNHT